MNVHTVSVHSVDAQSVDSGSVNRFGLWRFVLPLVVLATCITVRNWFRGFEATTVAQVLQSLGISEVTGMGSARVLVRPQVGSPFYALVSFGCSSLPVMTVFAVVALLLIRGSLRRRVVAASVAACIVLVVNVARVSAVVAIGSRYGLATMARAHDWFGTAVTLLGGVFAACALYVIAALPDKRQSNTEVSNA